MFNIGFSELVILGIIALIFIGPQQLPEVARTVGRLLNEWKRATSDLQSTITNTITEDLEYKRSQLKFDEPALPPSDHDVAVKVETSTPDTASLPEGSAPVAGHHHDDGNKS